MSIVDSERRNFFQTYKRLNLILDRGEGVYLIAADGKRYLDMFSGLAVNALGYNHPAVNAAMEKQMKRYLHVSNSFLQDIQVEFAEALLGAARYDRIFLSNSGTEAMEGALKLAKRWGRSQKRSMIYGLSDSFHGRTFGSLSITWRDKYRDGFEPFLPCTGCLPFNDVDHLEKNVNSSTLAVVFEPIQGEGGVRPISREYADALMTLKKKYGFLLIADEIQTGVGRTGKFLAVEHYSLTPDIVVMAKAIGGGLPLGAFIAKEALAGTLTQGIHGTTFGGNPLACAAGLATIREVMDGGKMSNAEALGGYLKTKLQDVANEVPGQVVDIRGMGFMLGCELKSDASKIVELALEEGVLLNVTNSNVVRWLPPLIAEKEHIDRAVSVFATRHGKL